MKRLAAALGHAAAQAPQPMHCAASIARSASGLGTRTEFASGALPARHSLAAANMAQCNAALANAAAGSGGYFLDFAADNEMTRDPANFIDATHYRAKIARHMEQTIAHAIDRAVSRSPKLAGE